MRNRGGLTITRRIGGSDRPNISRAIKYGEYRDEGSAILEEKLVGYYAANPAVALRDSCTVYGESELGVAEVAPVIGASIKQYQEIASNFLKGIHSEIPKQLITLSDPNEAYIMQYLPSRVLGILERLLDQDILLPKRQRFISSLWEDLKLLRFLQLVSERETGDLLHYSLNLSRIKWFR